MGEQVKDLRYVCDKLWSAGKDYRDLGGELGLTWGNWYSLEHQARTLSERVDFHEYQKQCDEIDTLQQARKNSKIPIISFVYSDFVPKVGWNGTEEAGSKAVHPRKSNIIFPLCEKGAYKGCNSITHGGTHTVMLLSSPAAIPYFISLNSQVHREIPFISCSQEDCAVDSVHKHIRRKYMTSWVVLLVDTTLLTQFGVEVNTGFWEKVEEKVLHLVNLIIARIGFKTGRGNMPNFVLNEVKFKKYKYYVCPIAPGVTVATTTFWVDSSPLIRELFYLPSL
jgi:hypothetical protein